MMIHGFGNAFLRSHPIFISDLTCRLQLRHLRPHGTAETGVVMLGPGMGG